MTEWPVKTLGEVCDFVSGSVTPKPGVKYEVFSVPSFDCGNPEILDGSEIKSSKRPVEPGDVLLCKINPRINRVWRVDRESKNQQIASTEWITLRCRGNVLDVYLQYVLQAPSARTAMIESVTGATGSHTRAKYEIVEELELSVPPLEEQRRIVALLDAANARVTELTACYEQARTHANNLFTSALRDALEGNPELPVKTLGSIFRVCSSKRVLKSEWKQSGVPFYRGREITALSKHGFVQNELFISEEHFSDLVQKYGVPKIGDIMITAIGTIGNSYVVKEADRFYFKDASVIWLDKQTEIMSSYVQYWIMSSRFRDQLNAGNGATVDTLTIDGLSKMQIPVPSLEEQKRIVARLDEMKAKTSEMVAAYEAKMTAAMNLRQSILEAAFAGDM